MTIRVLPPEVINQIAAGEVIERPFSVVKELVENALDAGAQRLRVEITDGGRAMIRITDDGAGFSPADLGLAFVSHATSKLGSLADLDHIASLGFRGEALASIGSVARVTIRSRQRDASAGHEITCDGGAIGEVRPCGCPPGTVVEVRDLFFNTPARRRFLKTPRAERTRVQDLLIRVALPRLDVDVTLVVDGNETLRLPADVELADRVGAAFGRRLADSLLPVDHAWGDWVVSGAVAQPDLARRDQTLELLWINGRCAKDRSSAHAVRQAFREYVMHGRYPVTFLLLSLPPDQVDVNVHPTKSEVRFVEARRVGGLLHEAVKGALAGRAEPAIDVGEAAADGTAATRAPIGGIDIGASRPRAASGFPQLPRSLFAADGAGGGDALAAARPSGSRAGGDAVAEPAPPARDEPAGRDNPFRSITGSRFLQVGKLYLVFEGEDGIVVVDQHALHERVLYERLRARHDAREEGLVQRLLVPEILELAPTDKAYLLNSAEVLAEEGLLIEDFGGPAISVTGIPAVLGRASPRAVVDAFLHGAGGSAGEADTDARPGAREAIVERFHTMSCRAAVMGGDRLHDDEIVALLEEAATLDHPHNCPHGRPTVLTFSMGELERYFRRRV